jgi:hypothetical protein
VFVVRKQQQGNLPLHVITQRDILRFISFRLGIGQVWENNLLP